MARPDLRTRTEAREYYSALRRRGLLHGTIRRAVDLWEARRAATDYRQHDEYCGLRARFRALPTIEPTVADRRAAADEARAAHPRRRNWDAVAADHTNGVVTHDHGQYSGRCRYTHYTYQPTTRSCAAVTRTRLVYWSRYRRAHLRAPRGWRYGRDALGIYVVRLREQRREYRYHVVGDDLTSVSRLRAAALAHEQRQRVAARDRRAAAARQRLRPLAESLGVYVSVVDSIRAGNCGAGTRAWARQHGLDLSRRYPASVLLRHDSSWQVARAVTAATDAACADLQRGYCIYHPDLPTG